jgi:hypothetical protein
MGKLAGGVWGRHPGIRWLQIPLHRRERRGHGSRWAPTAGARRGRPLLPKATKLQTRTAIWLPRSAAWSECTRCWVCCEGLVILIGVVMNLRPTQGDENQLKGTAFRPSLKQQDLGGH